MDTLLLEGPQFHLHHIRVVNAFRTGMDSQQLQQATSNPNIQRVLQKQASLSKRLSTASSNTDQQPQSGISPAAITGSAAATTTRIKIPEHSHSHTETAV